MVCGFFLRLLSPLGVRASIPAAPAAASPAAPVAVREARA